MNPEAHLKPPAEKRRKILVVDDNAVIIKTLSFKLKTSGFDVYTALDGADAVITVRKEKPDLILLDLGFSPDVGHGGVAWDGFLVMNWLRRIAEAKHTPIIVTTAGDPAKYEKLSLEAGAAAFFHKPIDHDALISVIHKTLSEPAGPPAANLNTT